MHDYWERKLNEETVALKQLRDIKYSDCVSF